jgi:hypothetical protein
MDLDLVRLLRDAIMYLSSSIINWQMKSFNTYFFNI